MRPFTNESKEGERELNEKLNKSLDFQYKNTHLTSTTSPLGYVIEELTKKHGGGSGKPRPYM